jgi:hypothetical protein
MNVDEEISLLKERVKKLEIFEDERKFLNSVKEQQFSNIPLSEKIDKLFENNDNNTINNYYYNKCSGNSINFMKTLNKEFNYKSCKEGTERYKCYKNLSDIKNETNHFLCENYKTTIKSICKIIKFNRRRNVLAHNPKKFTEEQLKRFVCDEIEEFKNALKLF